MNLTRYKHMPTDPTVTKKELRDAVDELVSKLEIAEKALELAVKELDAHDRNEHMEYGDFCSEYKPCAELTAINEALQQIRE